MHILVESTEFCDNLEKSNEFKKRIQKMAVNMLNNTQTDTDTNEINFTAFTDLCRFCSLRHGTKINLFEKEAEQRQILYKVRTFLPIAVNITTNFVKPVSTEFKISGVVISVFDFTDLQR